MAQGKGGANVLSFLGDALIPETMDRFRQRGLAEDEKVRREGDFAEIAKRMGTGEAIPMQHRSIAGSLFGRDNIPISELIARNQSPEALMASAMERFNPKPKTPIVSKPGDVIRSGDDPTQIIAQNPAEAERVEPFKPINMQRPGTNDVKLARTQEEFDRLAAAGYGLGGTGVPGAPAPTPPKDMFADEAKLRGEFADKTKVFEVVRDSYGKMIEMADNPSPAGDISLIFGYMKMLDPNSTVRESEYATAQNAGSVPERVRAMFNKAREGQTLTPGQRRDFITQAGRIYSSQLKTYRQDEGRYKDLAKTYGTTPDRVVYDRSGGLEPKNFNVPKVGEVEDGYRFVGGNPADETSWVKVN